MKTRPMAINRNFKPPPNPPHFTGELWKNRDGTLAAEISDVFNAPIHLVLTKEGDGYFIRGWRGKIPPAIHIPLIDGPEKVQDDE